LVDLKSACNLNGKQAETLLDTIYITCNKNTIPFDKEKPMLASGLRFGSAAMTTRGFNELEFYKVGKIISKCLKNPEDKNLHLELKAQVEELVKGLNLFNK
jgi:glycine hydroxymethyltransferase